ncbi:hypothetical protein Nepgr_020352 [Nepenthes gracilis]|uniref:Uncharacterized protein n=1 Tax=Nepenthes gracilis TaxID=150966 RepID=A0AAD3XW99_NEPGR|nr:hypothetical protein Nepgr_020352 [Nepenthes gracilis]
MAFHQLQQGFATSAPANISVSALPQCWNAEAPEVGGFAACVVTEMLVACIHCYFYDSLLKAVAVGIEYIATAVTVDGMGIV